MVNITILTLTPDNKSLFIDTLTAALTDKFGITVENLEDNYGYKYPWSLLSLIESNSIDTYQILYYNDLVWCASGGIIREHNNSRVYQIGFRGFSNHDSRHNGLGVKPLGTETLIKHQVERARLNNCDLAIMSFNEHNSKLFAVFKNYLMPRVFGKDSFVSSQTPVLFNGVPQWTLTLKL
jgi:hypothetical protein